MQLLLPRPRPHPRPRPPPPPPLAHALCALCPRHSRLGQTGDKKGGKQNGGTQKGTIELDRVTDVLLGLPDEYSRQNVFVIRYTDGDGTASDRCEVSLCIQVRDCHPLHLHPHGSPTTHTHTHTTATAAALSHHCYRRPGRRWCRCTSTFPGMRQALKVGIRSCMYAACCAESFTLRATSPIRSRRPTLPSRRTGLRR